MNPITNIAVFASGSGSNAQKIMDYFQGSVDIRVKYLLSNNKEAYVLERAKKMGIETKTFNSNAVDFMIEGEHPYRANRAK